MQSVSFRIWTRVAVSISYDDNITPRTPPHMVVFQFETYFTFSSFWWWNHCGIIFELYSNSSTVLSPWRMLLIMRGFKILLFMANSYLFSSIWWWCNHMQVTGIQRKRFRYMSTSWCKQIHATSLDCCSFMYDTRIFSAYLCRTTMEHDLLHYISYWLQLYTYGYITCTDQLTLCCVLVSETK